MQIRRIELEGATGRVTIERQRDSDDIRIDSILRNPNKGEQAWGTFVVTDHTSDEDLFEIAQTVQRRCDGFVGTNSDVHAYFREMQRFQN